MEQHGDEYERKKRAIFEAMSKRGQARILKMGYDNWDPFQEPKDPRERIFAPSAQRATSMLHEFYTISPQREVAQSYHRELFDLLLRYLNGDVHARLIVTFCAWVARRTTDSPS